LCFLLFEGYSNSYWGWGAEDDDLAVRIKLKKLVIKRPIVHFARYKMMRHKPQTENKKRFNLLKKTRISFESDGLNTLNTKILKTSHFKAFTHFLIDIGNN
jgi:beta-1,4-galactosyltransferase 3